MNFQPIAGIVLIATFLLVVAASIVGPSEVYTAPDNATRLAIIAENQAGWTWSNILWAISSLAAAAGMLLLSLGLRESSRGWIGYIAGAVFTIGAVAWAVYLVQRIIEPGAYLYTTPPPLMALIFVITTIVGLALYGLAFWLSDFPDWPGYLLLAANGLLALGFIFFFNTMYASFPPQTFYLLTLIVGIVSLRQ